MNAALLFGVLVSGCAFRAGYDELPEICGAAICPSGLECIEGVCLLIPPEDSPDAGSFDVDAEVGPDATGPAPDAGINPPPPTACGSMYLLRDNFDDGVRSDLWIPTAQSGVSLIETDGHLAVRLAAGSAGVEGAYRSKASYDLKSSALSARVLRTAGQITAIEVRDFDERGGAIGVEGDTLVAMTLDRDAESIRVATVYDPVRHAHWRLREGSGTLFWETSPDAATWSVLHSEALPMTGTYAFAYLLAWGQTPTAGEAWFDDVNLPVTASPGLCKASSVTDGFDDGSLRGYNNWIGSGACTGREASGSLELSFPGSGESFCGVETSQLVDLRNDAIRVQIVTAPTASRTMAFFEAVSIEPSAEVEMLVESGVLYLSVFRDGSPVVQASTVFSPTADRYWQIRESAGRTYFETSPDGASWTTKYSLVTPVDLSAVIVDMAAGHYSPGPGFPQTIRFDNLNR